MGTGGSGAGGIRIAGPAALPGTLAPPPPLPGTPFDEYVTAQLGAKAQQMVKARQWVTPEALLKHYDEHLARYCPRGSSYDPHIYVRPVLTEDGTPTGKAAPSSKNGLVQFVFQVNSTVNAVVGNALAACPIAALEDLEALALAAVNSELGGGGRGGGDDAFESFASLGVGPLAQHAGVALHFAVPPGVVRFITPSLAELVQAVVLYKRKQEEAEAKEGVHYGRGKGAAGAGAGAPRRPKVHWETIGRVWAEMRARREVVEAREAREAAAEKAEKAAAAAAAAIAAAGGAGACGAASAASAASAATASASTAAASAAVAAVDDAAAAAAAAAAAVAAREREEEEVARRAEQLFTAVHPSLWQKAGALSGPAYFMQTMRATMSKVRAGEEAAIKRGIAAGEMAATVAGSRRAAALIDNMTVGHIVAVAAAARLLPLPGPALAANTPKAARAAAQRLALQTQHMLQLLSSRLRSALLGGLAGTAPLRVDQLDLQAHLHVTDGSAGAAVGAGAGAHPTAAAPLHAAPPPPTYEVSLDFQRLLRAAAESAERELRMELISGDPSLRTALLAAALLALHLMGAAAAAEHDAAAALSRLLLTDKDKDIGSQGAKDDKDGPEAAAAAKTSNSSASASASAAPTGLARELAGAATSSTRELQLELEKQGENPGDSEEAAPSAVTLNRIRARLEQEGQAALAASLSRRLCLSRAPVPHGVASAIEAQADADAVAARAVGRAPAPMLRPRELLHLYSHIWPGLFTNTGSGATVMWDPLAQSEPEPGSERSSPTAAASATGPAAGRETAPAAKAASAAAAASPAAASAAVAPAPAPAPVLASPQLLYLIRQHVAAAAEQLRDDPRQAALAAAQLALTSALRVPSWVDLRLPGGSSGDAQQKNGAPKAAAAATATATASLSLADWLAAAEASGDDDLSAAAAGILEPLAALELDLSLRASMHNDDDGARAGTSAAGAAAAAAATPQPQTLLAALAAAASSTSGCAASSGGLATASHALAARHVAAQLLACLRTLSLSGAAAAAQALSEDASEAELQDATALLLSSEPARRMVARILIQGGGGAGAAAGPAQVTAEDASAVASSLNVPELCAFFRVAHAAGASESASAAATGDRAAATAAVAHMVAPADALRLLPSTLPASTRAADAANASAAVAAGAAPQLSASLLSRLAVSGDGGGAEHAAATAPIVAAAVSALQGMPMLSDTASCLAWDDVFFPELQMPLAAFIELPAVAQALRMAGVRFVSERGGAVLLRVPGPAGTGMAALTHACNRDDLRGIASVAAAMCAFGCRDALGEHGPRQVLLNQAAAMRSCIATWLDSKPEEHRLPLLMCFSTLLPASTRAALGAVVTVPLIPEAGATLAQLRSVLSPQHWRAFARHTVDALHALPHATDSAAGEAAAPSLPAARAALAAALHGWLGMDAAAAASGREAAAAVASARQCGGAIATSDVRSLLAELVASMGIQAPQAAAAGHFGTAASAVQLPVEPAAAAAPAVSTPETTASVDVPADADSDSELTGATSAAAPPTPSAELGDDRALAVSPGDKDHTLSSAASAAALAPSDDTRVVPALSAPAAAAVSACLPVSLAEDEFEPTAQLLRAALPSFPPRLDGSGSGEPIAEPRVPLSRLEARLWTERERRQWLQYAHQTLRQAAPVLIARTRAAAEALDARVEAARLGGDAVEAERLLAAAGRARARLDALQSADHVSPHSRVEQLISASAALVSQDLYRDKGHFLLELVQNSDDVLYAPGETPTLRLCLRTAPHAAAAGGTRTRHHDAGDEQALAAMGAPRPLSGVFTAHTSEIGFTGRDLTAICRTGVSSKAGSAGRIGRKGVGFKSLFKLARHIEVASGPLRFAFDTADMGEGGLGTCGQMAPLWLLPRNPDDRAADDGAGAGAGAGGTDTEWDESGFPMAIAPWVATPAVTKGTRFTFALEKHAKEQQTAAASSGVGAGSASAVRGAPAAAKGLLSEAELKGALEGLRHKQHMLVFLRKLRRMQVRIERVAPAALTELQDADASASSAVESEFSLLRHSDVPVHVAGSWPAAAELSSEVGADSGAEDVLPAAHSACVVSITTSEAPASASTSWWLKQVVDLPISQLQASGLAVPASSALGSSLEIAFPGTDALAFILPALRPDLAAAGVPVDSLALQPAGQPQYACAFLPVETCGMPFTVNADLEVPASREAVGDTPFNRWVLTTALPAALAAAFETLCSLVLRSRASGSEVAASSVGEGRVG